MTKGGSRFRTYTNVARTSHSLFKLGQSFGNSDYSGTSDTSSNLWIAWLAFARERVALLRYIFPKKSKNQHLKISK